MICDACKKEKKEVEMTPNRFSFKGYEFKEWAKRNKDSIKTILSTTLSLTSFFYVGLENVILSGAIALIVGEASKLIIDGFSYWLSK
jgi:hypothetical protein